MEAHPEQFDEHQRWSVDEDRKSTRLNSSHSQISYAVFCLKKKKQKLQCSIFTPSARCLIATHLICSNASIAACGTKPYSISVRVRGPSLCMYALNYFPRLC